MTSSGTYNWFLDNAGVVTEAFGRCGIRPTALTREHFVSATRSLNLALQSWSNKGVNLFQVDLQQIPLVQGVPAYTLPSNTVNILDAYLETYQFGTTVNQAPNFSTQATSTTVVVVQDGHGLTTSNWINIPTQVAIGGIGLSGLYQVTVVNGNEYTIQSAVEATGTVSNGGSLTLFETAINSATITCVLDNHGLAANEDFTVQVATEVGGISLFGAFIVGSVIDVNTFTFTAEYQAAFNDSEYENGGDVQIMTQASSADPIDRIMTSISRTDYAALPDKSVPGVPTTFWFDRLSPIPTATVWQVPDGNGPYVFFYYRMRRIQDANAQSGETADIPYRFIDALCAELAYRLSGKYAPQLKMSLKEDMDVAWAQAAEEDRERVQLFLQPDLSGYYNF